MNHVVIFCGGLGTRMLAHGTDKLPNSLLPVCGVPFLYWQLDRLANAGATHVTLCIGHKGDQIRKALERYAAQDNRGLRIEIIDQGETSFGLTAAEDLVRKEVKGYSLWTYGDVYHTGDWLAPLHVLTDQSPKAARLDNVMGVYEVDEPPNVCGIRDPFDGELYFARGGRMGGYNYVECGAIAIHPRAPLLTSDRTRLHVMRRPYEIGSPEGFEKFWRYVERLAV